MDYYNNLLRADDPDILTKMLVQVDDIGDRRRITEWIETNRHLFGVPLSPEEYIRTRVIALNVLYDPHETVQGPVV